MEITKNVNLETVIVGLKDFIQAYQNAFDDDAEQPLIDALALLELQEPVEPKQEETPLSKSYGNDIFRNYYCGKCGHYLRHVVVIDKFCSQCGKAVKWE